MQKLIKADDFDINACSENETVTPRTIVLLADGKVIFDFKDVDVQKLQFQSLLKHKQTKTKEQKMHLLFHSLALTILWCAEYNLDSFTPLEISDDLQNLLMEMCEKNIIDPDQLQSRCEASSSAPHLFREALARLYHYVMGSSDELHRYSNNYFIQNKLSMMPSTKLSCKDFINPGLNELKLLGQTYSIATEDSIAGSSSQQSLSSSTNQQTSSEQSKHHESLKKMLTLSQPHKSILQCGADLPVICIDNCDENSATCCSLQVVFLNRIRMKIVLGGTQRVTVRKVLVAVLNHLKFTQDCSTFALSILNDNEYLFLEKDLVLSKALPPNVTTLHLKIMFYPTNIAALRSSHLEAIYMQTRADVVDEKLACSHDDVLNLCSFALQCEIDDYKADYGLNYYLIEDYACKTAINQLGVSYIRSQASTMHRQLAGIGPNEARLLFLRRCQNLEEYGTHVYRIYRHRSCKDEENLWMGVGPRGLCVFEMKRRNGIRIKKHSHRWNNLKKFAWKSKKLSMILREPADEKLKFYHKTNLRTKYLGQLSAAMHEYYVSERPINQFSSLALFDDITRLSSPALDVITTTTRHSTSTRDISSLSSFSSSLGNEEASVHLTDMPTARSSVVTQDSSCKSSPSKETNTTAAAYLLSPLRKFSKRADKLKFSLSSSSSGSGKHRAMSPSSSCDLLSITRLSNVLDDEAVLEREGGVTVGNSSANQDAVAKDDVSSRSKMYKLLSDENDTDESESMPSHEADC